MKINSILGQQRVRFRALVCAFIVAAMLPRTPGALWAAEIDEPAAAATRLVQLAGRTMGTTYRLKYWGDGPTTPEAMHEAVEFLLAEFDLQMSTYRQDSELSRFNHAPAHEWFPVSEATAHVIEEALRLHELTAGALDVTVGPALRLWGFGPEVKRDAVDWRPPSDESLQQALKLVGAQRVRVRRSPPALWKETAAVELDLSALAPGYAVDQIVELVQSKGFAHAMVELGGEVRAAGVRPDGSPWRIGVERAGLHPPRRELLQVVPLRDLSLTTAGDYHNYRTVGGRRITHIVDPRTGQALPYRGVAVTVIMPTCLDADALDTALMVMGPDEGRRWCDKHAVAALWQYRADGGQPTVAASRRWRELFDE